MSQIVTTSEGMFVKNKNRIDLEWLVLAGVTGNQEYTYGVIGIQTIRFPRSHIGKHFRIKLEGVKKVEGDTNEQRTN